jgi:hypothetical protein
MAIPWLRILDAAVGLTSAVRSARRPAASHELEALGKNSSLGTAIEARLAGVVVSALKEAFDRDHQRLELEREQIEAERQRSERVLRLELLRQAADREIGRLRLIAGIVVATWLGTLFFSQRVLEGPGPDRAILAAGWVLLLAALAATFVGQSVVARDIERATAQRHPPEGVSSGTAGVLAPWLFVAGLGVVALALLVA